MEIKTYKADFEVPFKTKISFKKVIDFWEAEAKGKNPIKSAEAKNLLKELESAPVLREPFDDLEILTKYKKEIELLLSALFPKALQLNEIKAATLPFKQVFFNMTERFNNIINKAGGSFQFMFEGYDEDFMYLMSSSLILNRFYGANLNLSRPTIFSIPDNTSGIVRTYRGFFNADFSELRKTPDSPDLSEDQIHMLLSDTNNIKLWKKIIPPNSFEMHGFGLLTIFDVTIDQALSKLKYALIKKDALVTSDILNDMEIHMRQLFNLADLQMGIVIVYGDELKSVKKNSWNSIVLHKKHKIEKDSAFCEYSYEHLFSQKKFLAISDVDKIDVNPSPLFKLLKETDMKSYIINPLTNDDQVIGFLELGSKEPGALSTLASSHLEEIIPLFSIALGRSWDEFENQIQALIKEKATAIHPTVEWRFAKAAYNLFRARAVGEEAEMEEIVFDRVFPLYGQMDIKSSSTFREKGIQQDLLTQLGLAKNVLNQALKREKLLIYDQLIYQIDTHVKQVEEKITAGYEASVQEFFRKRIDPVFEHLQSVEGMKKRLTQYRKRIDPRIGMVSDGRKLYEDTVTQINEHISACINKAQVEAQKVFPHYFEKYKTDGVEYNIYIGQSLVEKSEYNELFLKNLRLWQLIMTCEVENLVDTIRPEFKVPLQIASLILVQNRPLDIKFRQDEKKFDVDGAYNARYEIIKKRIDKALVHGKEERLTQPGKIAIVFSNEAEKREYETYLDFLIDKNYIKPEIEYLQLGDLQGASGLQALRVAVVYHDNRPIMDMHEEVKALLEDVN